MFDGRDHPWRQLGTDGRDTRDCSMPSRLASHDLFWSDDRQDFVRVSEGSPTDERWATAAPVRSRSDRRAPPRASARRVFPPARSGSQSAAATLRPGSAPGRCRGWRPDSPDRAGAGIEHAVGDLGRAVVLEGRCSPLYVPCGGSRLVDGRGQDQVPHGHRKRSRELGRYVEKAVHRRAQGQDHDPRERPGIGGDDVRPDNSLPHGCETRTVTNPY